MVEGAEQNLVGPLNRRSRQVRRRGAELGLIDGKFVLWSPAERQLCQVSVGAAMIWLGLEGEEFGEILDDFGVGEADAMVDEAELRDLFRFLRSVGMVEDATEEPRREPVVSHLSPATSISIRGDRRVATDGSVSFVIDRTDGARSEPVEIDDIEFSALRFVIVDPSCARSRPLEPLEVLTYVMDAADSPLSAVIRAGRSMSGTVVPDADGGAHGIDR